MLSGVEEWSKAKFQIDRKLGERKETKETRLRHPTQWTKESEGKTLKEVELSSSLYIISK